MLPELQGRLEQQVRLELQVQREQQVPAEPQALLAQPVLRVTQEQLGLQVPLDQRAQRERLEQRVLVWFLRARGIAVKRTKQRTL